MFTLYALGFRFRFSFNVAVHIFLKTLATMRVHCTLHDTPQAASVWKKESRIPNMEATGASCYELCNGSVYHDLEGEGAVPPWKPSPWSHVLKGSVFIFLSMDDNLWASSNVGGAKVGVFLSLFYRSPLLDHYQFWR